MSEPHVHEPWDRPLVAVLIDRTWYLGELRAWFPTDDGGWHGNVAWSRAPGDTRSDDFPAEAIRLVE